MALPNSFPVADDISSLNVDGVNDVENYVTNSDSVANNNLETTSELISLSKVNINSDVANNNLDVSNENLPVTRCSESTIINGVTDESVKVNITSKISKLKLGCLNIRSLIHKVEQIQVFTDQNNFDILAVNETWLDESILDSDISLNNYKILRNDRETKGGGVCLYIKSEIKYNKINVNTGIESVWISVREGKDLLAIGTIYRPPNSERNYFEKMLDEIQIIINKFQHVIILGDLNWNCTSNQNNTNNEIVQIESMFNLRQIVDSPTRVTLHTATLLDVILTSNYDKCINTSVIPISISDHYCVATEYILMNNNRNKDQHMVVTYRNYKNFCSARYIEELSNNNTLTDLNFKQDELENRWQKFKEVFLEISNKHAPVTSRRLKDRYNPWITRDIIQLMYERDYKKRQAVKHNSQQEWIKYCQIRNEINVKIKNAKKSTMKMN